MCLGGSEGGSKRSKIQPLIKTENESEADKTWASATVDKNSRVTGREGKVQERLHNFRWFDIGEM